MFVKAAVLCSFLISLCLRASQGKVVQRSLIHAERNPVEVNSNPNENDDLNSNLKMGARPGGRGEKEVDGGHGRPTQDTDEGRPQEDVKIVSITKPANYDEIVKAEMESNVIEENDEVIEDEGEEGKGGTLDKKLRWDYEMTIKIDPGFSQNQKEMIKSAVWTLNGAMVCFKFMITTGPVSNSKDHLYIRHEHNKGCASHLGRVGGKQETIISDSCVTVYGTTMHEILHVLGFFHEHVRSDRDKYVTVNWDVLYNENQKHQFVIRDNQGLFAKEYDFESIMHYPLSGALQAKKGKIPKGITVGQRNHLSAKDIDRLRKMYPCKNGYPEDEFGR